MKTKGRTEKEAKNRMNLPDSTAIAWLSDVYIYIQPLYNSGFIVSVSLLELLQGTE